jgi:prepilin-type N-terminal cleavage/methylation domain-containing protein
MERINMGCTHFKPTVKTKKKSHKGFTLIELLVILLIILTLSSIGIFAYKRAIAQAKETVCTTNLKALRDAIDFYLSENDALPASLGQLKFEHLERGYARAMEENRWLKKLCYFLVKLDASDRAYAQFLTYENLKKYGVTEEIFHCPADPNGGTSYGINGNLVGVKWSDIPGNVLVVADSDVHVFTSESQLSKRHRHKALVATKDGEVAAVYKDPKKQKVPVLIKEFSRKEVLLPPQSKPATEKTED